MENNDKKFRAGVVLGLYILGLYREKGKENGNYYIMILWG